MFLDQRSLDGRRYVLLNCVYFHAWVDAETLRRFSIDAPTKFRQMWDVFVDWRSPTAEKRRRLSSSDTCSDLQRLGSTPGA